MCRADALTPDRPHIPFFAGRSTPAVMERPHAHSDIEFNLPLSGSLSYFFAGRFLVVPPGSLAVFWAGVPHRLTRTDPPGDTEYVCMTVPLGWFLAWRIAGGALAERLLSGEMIARSASEIERLLFLRWADECGSRRGVAWQDQTALLEVEACLRRLAAEGSPDTPPSPRNPVAGGQAERLAACASERYHDPELSAASVAAAAGLSEKYALAVFKAGCGMTLWEYVTRLRVSHAQRLLLTTDWNVDRIGRESGFGSPGRFFAAFRARTGGATPRRYRMNNGL